MTQSKVKAVEGQVEEGEHEEEGERHINEEDHHEDGGSYSPLSPDNAKTYSSSNKTTATTPDNLSITSLMKQGFSYNRKSYCPSHSNRIRRLPV